MTWNVNSYWLLWWIKFLWKYSIHYSVATLKGTEHTAATWYMPCTGSSNHPTMYQITAHGLFFERYIFLDPLHGHSQFHKAGLSLHQSNLKCYEKINRCLNVSKLYETFFTKHNSVIKMSRQLMHNEIHYGDMVFQNITSLSVRSMIIITV
jgi:hypothetical protein